MRRFSFLVLLVAILAIGSAAARAEMGACQPDDHAGIAQSLICGSGNGAARVIRNTVSPLQRLALAWRTAGPPTEVPDGDPKLELLIVRLKDGAILHKSKGVYWDTGDTHIDNIFERATWSPDARLLIETLDSRYASDAVSVYAVAQDDTVAGPFDLLKLIEPAIRALMKDVKDAESYSFSIAAKPAMAIDIFGHFHVTAMMWMPKLGPQRYYDVTGQVIRNANSLDAKLLSAALSHVDKGQ
jgi:hypothetical protein